MDGDGPFLWLSEYAPPAGFKHVPTGGMCVCAFLFVRNGDQILLGRQREHPDWETLTGLDPPRVKRYAKGWTLPARQLRFGEDPRQAARQIADEVLQLPGLRLSEPHVETDHYQLGDLASGPPERKKLWHYDISFFFDAQWPPGADLRAPPWYEALEWKAPAAVPRDAFARGHEDIVERWLHPTGRR